MKREAGLHTASATKQQASKASKARSSLGKTKQKKKQLGRDSVGEWARLREDVFIILQNEARCRLYGIREREITLEVT